jgi:hypothetical protein
MSPDRTIPSNEEPIILAPQQRYEIGDLMRGVLKLINTKSPEEMQGQLEFLSN